MLQPPPQPAMAPAWPQPRHRRSRRVALIAALLCLSSAAGAADTVGAADTTGAAVPGDSWPGGATVPVVGTAVGDPPLQLRFALPSSLDVAVAGVEPGAAYEARLSFLGSPTVWFTIAVLAPTRLRPATGRRPLDVELVRFVADDASVFPLDGRAAGGGGTVTLRISASAKSVAAAPGDGRWVTRHAVLSVRPLLLGLVTADSVLVVAAAVAAAAVAVVAIVPWWLRQLADTRRDFAGRNE